MYAVLRLGSRGEVVAANAAADTLLGPSAGARCCDVVLARGDQRRVVCGTGCAASLCAGGQERDQRGVRIRGRLCRLVCTRVGDEAVVIITAGPADAAAVHLTRRERQVLGLVARGLENDPIAARLGIGAATVRTHLERAREKLGAKTRAQAVALALVRGELDEGDPGI